MRYSQAQPGRIFILRLEDGDILHATIENFARQQNIRAAALLVLGGADAGSRLVVGPTETRGLPVVPMELDLPAAHEITGVGTLFPDEAGQPYLHMHIAGGRQDQAVVGCVRQGVKTWYVLEVVLYELTETTARRMHEDPPGFTLLQP